MKSYQAWIGGSTVASGLYPTRGKPEGRKHEGWRGKLRLLDLLGEIMQISYTKDSDLLRLSYREDSQDAEQVNPKVTKDGKFVLIEIPGGKGFLTNARDIVDKAGEDTTTKPDIGARTRLL